MTVTKVMDEMMPMGMSRRGFFTSSAIVDTQSKPMKLHELVWVGFS